MLRRIVLLCLAAAVYMSALVYPWFVQSPWVLKLDAQPANAGWLAWFFHDQVRGQLLSAHSPLVLKEAVAQTLLLASLVACCVLMLLRTMRESGSGGSRVAKNVVRGWMASPGAWTVLLLVYLAVTVVGIRIGDHVLLQGSPTFHYSIRSLFAFGLGCFLVLALPMMRVDRAWTVKFMAGLTLCGAVVAFVALLQHLGLAGAFMPEYGDPRNRMSSLIGHNTGMSSWLMFPLSFALYFTFANRRLWVRWTATVLVALFLFVIIAAQSRAIWVLGFGLAAVSVVAQFRIFGRRVSGRNLGIGVAVVLALIALQTVGPRWNPFARGPVSLAQRLMTSVLNADQLRRETRLRVTVVSLSELVPKHPLKGTGFGSFQWVYPPAQGHYLAEHLDTKLGYTTKRTDLAHNDYVQMLVEAGLIGCLLLAVPVFLLLRKGWSAVRVAEIPHDRALLLAVAMPVVGVCIHALIDFPFHVVPTALEAAACLGLWAASRQWIVAEEAESVPVLPTTAPPLIGEAGPGIRYRAVLVLAVTFSALFWVPLAVRNLIYRELASDAYTQEATNWLNTFRQLKDKNDLQGAVEVLNRAIPMLRRAIVVNVFNGAAYEQQALAFSYRGAMLFTQAAQAQAQQRTKEADAMLSAARSDFESTIRGAENQVKNGELRYHFTYQLIGNGYKYLWFLNPDPKDIKQTNYYKSALDAYEMGLETNIADVDTMVQMIDLLQKGPTRDEQAIATNWGRLFRIDREYAQQNILNPAVKTAEAGAFEAANRQLEMLQHYLPQNTQIMAARALAYYYKSVWLPPELDKVDTPLSATLEYRRAALAPGLPLLDEVKRDASLADSSDDLQMLYSFSLGEYEKARELAKKLLTRNPYFPEALVIRDMSDDLSGAQRKMDSEGATYKRTRNLYTLYFSGDKKAAAIGMVSDSFYVKLEMKEAARLMAFLRNNGWQAVIDFAAKQIIKQWGHEPLVMKYMPEKNLKAATGGAKK